MFDNILEKNNCFQDYKKEKFKKSKNWDFFKGVSPWFWSKMWNLAFFFPKIRQKKNVWRSSKSQKIDIFPKGLTHGFSQKWAIFSTFFFLGIIGQENVFHYILERKNAFLGYKKKMFNKSKNWHFPKGVNPWFSSTNGHFSNFFF